MSAYSKSKTFGFKQDDIDNFAQDFLDFYESKGWKVGNGKMKSWEASARKWIRGNFEKQKNLKSQNSKNYGRKHILQTAEKHDTSEIDYSRFD